MAKVERSLNRTVVPSIVHRLPILILFLLTSLASLQGYTLPEEAQHVADSEGIWKAIESGEEKALENGRGYNQNLALSMDKTMPKPWEMRDQTYFGDRQGYTPNTAKSLDKATMKQWAMRDQTEEGGRESEAQDNVNAYSEDWRSREVEKQKEVVHDSTEDKDNVSNKGDTHGEGDAESLAKLLETALLNQWMEEQPSEDKVPGYPGTEIPGESETNNWGGEGETSEDSQVLKAWWEEDKNKTGEEQKEDILWEEDTTSKTETGKTETGKTEMGKTGGADGDEGVTVGGEGDGSAGGTKEVTEGKTGDEVEVKGDEEYQTENFQLNTEQDLGEWKKVEEDQENENIFERKDNYTQATKNTSWNPGIELDPVFLFVLMALGIAVVISAFVTLIWFLKSRQHVGFQRIKQTDDDMDEQMEDDPFNHYNK